MAYQFSTFKTLKIIMVCVAVSFLTACATGLSSKYNPQEFAKNQKGVVVVRMSQNDPGNLGKTDLNLTYHLKKVGDKNHYVITGKNAFFSGISNKHNYSDSIIMLDPGTYYIDYISLNSEEGYNSTTLYSFPAPGYDTIPSDKFNNALAFKYGAFTVNPGEVIYLGHLHLKGDRVLPFQNINEFEKAREDLSKKHDNLALRIKPAQFYQGGSLYLEDNKKAKLVSINEIEKIQSQKRKNLVDDVIGKI